VSIQHRYLAVYLNKEGITLEPQKEYTPKLNLICVCIVVIKMGKNVRTFSISRGVARANRSIRIISARGQGATQGPQWVQGKVLVGGPGAILQQYMNIQIQIILMEIAHSIYMKGVIQLHVHVQNTTQI